MLRNYLRQNVKKYRPRLVDDDVSVKIVFDSVILEKNENDVCPILKTSENEHVIAEYFKDTDRLDIDTYKSIIRTEKACGGERKEFDSMYENGIIPDSIYDVSDMFFYKVIEIKNPHIHTYQTALPVRYRWLYPYVDKLKDIEKFFSIMKPDDVFDLMEKHQLDISEGKKLKQISGVPTDIMEMMNRMEMGKRIVDIRKMLSVGYDANDIRDALKFVEKSCSISNRTSFGRVFNDEDCTFEVLFNMICAASNSDGKKSLSRVINYSIRDAINYRGFSISNIKDILREYRDCYTMMSQYGISIQLEQNITKNHFYVSRNHKAMKTDRNDEYEAVAKEQNAYAITTKEYTIKMPESILELVKIGIAYNNCLPTYVNRIIDDGAIVYSIYKADQEIPPVTFELSRNYDIIQVKTYNDMDVEDQDTLAIVRSFARRIKNQKKGLAA